MLSLAVLPALSNAAITLVLRPQLLPVLAKRVGELLRMSAECRSQYALDNQHTHVYCGLEVPVQLYQERCAAAVRSVLPSIMQDRQLEGCSMHAKAADVNHL